MQHPKCCTKNLTVFKFDPTSSNMFQHVATYRNRVAKRMQHVVPNNVAKCWVEMLRAFGQAFIHQGHWCFKEMVTGKIYKILQSVKYFLSHAIGLNASRDRILEHIR